MLKKLTVSQLSSYIAGVFEDETVLHDITVTGEAGEIKRYGPRVFFTLSDGPVSISCVSFKKLENLEEGKSIEASGTVNYYKKNGRVSLMVSSVALTGEGAELARLKALKEKLEKEGIFSNRPPLPETVNKIAVITSESGAVIHDIISVVRAKNRLVSVTLFGARVQGENSAETIIHALEKLNANPFGSDVIIIARGGGSGQDLSSFNDENLARAVSSSRIPVISAVGHETDWTLCDLASSARAGTPSIAADMAVKPLQDYTDKIYGLSERISSSVTALYAKKEKEIVFASQKLLSANELKISEYTYKVLNLASEAERKVSDRLGEAEQKTALLAEKLDAVSPLKVLKQGYSKVTKDGKEIHSSKELKTSDGINIVFSDGKVSAEVK